MVETVILRFNYTGRKFMCIENKSEYIDDDGVSYYDEGEIYYEALADATFDNHIRQGEDVLLIHNKYMMPMYVEGKNFTLVEETLHPSIINIPFCAN